MTRFTAEEDKIIAEGVALGASVAQIATRLPGRLWASVEYRIGRLGLPMPAKRQQRAWTAEDLARLDTMAGERWTLHDAARALCRSQAAVFDMMRRRDVTGLDCRAFRRRGDGAGRRAARLVWAAPAASADAMASPTSAPKADTPRKCRRCLTCEKPFLSEGAHHRMCAHCRARVRDASPYGLGLGL